MHVYNPILTFNKLTIYSASVVESNFGNFDKFGVQIPLFAPWARPGSLRIERVTAGAVWRMRLNYDGKIRYALW